MMTGAPRGRGRRARAMWTPCASVWNPPMHRGNWRGGRARRGSLSFVASVVEGTGDADGIPVRLYFPMHRGGGVPCVVRNVETEFAFRGADVSEGDFRALCAVVERIAAFRKQCLCRIDSGAVVEVIETD